ncbi:ABC transporter ATP-binding protein [Aliamphritea spongicola]|uniref:ABC transporter ATP-binding protein n=1 Tax=Aliamphritea spongicola TaxID=707589 RepID=UPI00196AA267|nr:ABC transporter ATP-binding protein [Aliamphritea spongicola]MBN3563563.1 ABC transporter ATP-binding protein [Aliamphritea spongicola]
MYAEQQSIQDQATDQPLLEIQNLAVSFMVHGSEIPAVKDVSFTIPKGKTVAIVGESGSGKSVTSQAILGILPSNGRISNGSIQYHCKPKNKPAQVVDIATLAPTSHAMRDLRGDEISIIFQEPMVSLSPVHTLLDQIGEALKLHKQVSKSEVRDAVLSMLEKTGFPDPEKALNQYPFELSGGLRQRAMISMALICQPALLIADEPTTALDVTVQAQILQLIKSLQAEFGMSVLLITHDLGVVANMADEVVVMFHGEVVERGPIEALFNNPQHPYLKALFAAIPTFDMADNARLTSLRPVELDSHYLQQQRKPWSQQEREHAPHLSIQQLGKDYYTRHGSWHGSNAVIHAVRDFNLDIPVGESFGLVGESGCGKTTLSKMLMRAISPTQGNIVYNDRGTSRHLLELDDPALRNFRQKMQFVFQDPFSSLSPRMTVLDILCEPFVIHGIGDAAFHKQRAKELMALVGLDARFLNRYPHSFSGGQRQRISIARALALQPDLLILDEPVSALDVSVQAQILNLLKDLQRDLDLTYLFISHNLAVVDYIADRIGVMCRGQLVEIAPRHSLFQNPQHPYTHALLAAIPYPELERPLDYSQLDRRHMEPTHWPRPYRLSEDDAGILKEVGDQHFVREATL